MINQFKTHRGRNRFHLLVKASFGMIALVVAVGGCASSDPSSVHAARARVDAARGGGLVDSDSLDFQEAERHLAEAERLLEANEKQDLIDHEAEMAVVYSEVAVARTEATAAKLESSSVLTDALDQRDAIVEGHADNRGAADYNALLSKRRADSIRAGLIEFGVDEARLVSEGYGSQFPVASNDTAEGREQNRRVEIVILKPGLTAQEAHR